jgi:predicted Zn-dependent protease
LPYSRDHETEADVEGLRYAIRAGYNPEEAPKLWERMAKLGGGSQPEWLSTHPNSEARAQKLREMIPVIREQEKNWQPKKAVAPGALPGGSARGNG